MQDFQLQFDLEPGEILDDFALLARQDYNLGGRGDWFGCFRGGLYAFYARVYGVRVHYHEVHSWSLTRRGKTGTEYHLSSIFFNMDSAVECCAFAMNALGCAVSPGDFLDVMDERKLRQVGPWNVIGSATRSALVGYGKYFPSFQSHWESNKDLLNVIVNQHDVSKHRTTIFTGGKVRMDPPTGFFEALGIPDEPGIRYQFSPMEEIILDPEPKKPSNRTASTAYEDLKKLESVSESFRDFINKSCELALEDARKHIPLTHSEFLKQVELVYIPDVPLYKDPGCTIKWQDVTGLILGVEFVGYGIRRGAIVPTTKASYYKKGMTVSPATNFENKWDETWYVDPEDGQKKLAWKSAAEFVGTGTNPTA